MQKLLLGILIFSLFLFPDTDGYCIDILVDNGKGEPGDIVEINIYLATYSGETISAFGLVFNYDYGNLTYISGSDIEGDLTENFDFLQSNQKEGGKIVFSGVDSGDPIPENSLGSFLKVQLQVRNYAIPGDYPLTIDELVDNLEEANVINGQFTIPAPPAATFVDIYSNGTTFGPNDTMQINVNVINSSEDVINMFAALVIGETYFFYPLWDKTPHPTEVIPGLWDDAIAVIPLQQNRPVGTYTFAAAITDYEVKNVLGFDSVTVQIK